MPKAPADIRSMARGHTAVALRTLVSIMNHPDAAPAARLAAANAILDRGWGKTVQAVNEGESGPTQVTITWQTGTS